jgi:hypothetical protein
MESFFLAGSQKNYLSCTCPAAIRIEGSEEDKTLQDALKIREEIITDTGADSIARQHAEAKNVIED